MDDFIENFVAAINARSPQSSERLTKLRALSTRIVDLAESNSDVDELGIAATALSELLDAAKIFSPWRQLPKLTVFGSARVKPGNPLYEMASELSRRMASRGWITVSGAGPGIMEAAAKGAGRENTLGVNIALPFEQGANSYVDAETRLVEMKYFFTRKVALTKESMAFAFFPGGLGTMDETFEILTLLHTGKSKPVPLLLVDTLEGRFWEKWRDFMSGAVVADGYLEEQSSRLYQLCHSLDAATTEIERFYANYVSCEVVGARARIVVRAQATAQQVKGLEQSIPVFAHDGGYQLENPTTISFPFDGRQYLDLRLLIDEVNKWTN